MHNTVQNSPLSPGFKNDVHRTVSYGTGRTAVYSTSLSACYVTMNGVRKAATRWHVWVTLFGSAWSDNEVRRAERNARYLPPGTSKSEAIAVRDSLSLFDTL